MDKIYTVKQAAKILDFSTNTVYKYLDEGTLEGARGVGKQARFRIPHAALEKYLGAPLSEDQVLAKLDPDEFARRYPQGQSAQVSSFQASGIPQHFPLIISRFLIVASLIFIILDLVLNQNFTLTTQLLRMGTIAVFVLLAYQFGGYSKA